jgi:hypothetical protein
MLEEIHLRFDSSSCRQLKNVQFPGREDVARQGVGSTMKDSSPTVTGRTFDEVTFFAGAGLDAPADEGVRVRSPLQLRVGLAFSTIFGQGHLLAFFLRMQSNILVFDPSAPLPVGRPEAGLGRSNVRTGTLFTPVARRFLRARPGLR